MNTAVLPVDWEGHPLVKAVRGRTCVEDRVDLAPNKGRMTTY